MLEHGPNPTQNPSTSSQEVSPVKMFPQRENESGFEASEADFGLRCCEWFASYDHKSSSWRTSQGCLIEGRTRFTGRWPRSVLMLAGKCYRAACLVRHTHAKECSLWPVPTASRGGGNAGGSGSRAKARKNGTYVSERLNPELQEWLMGFPIGWTDVKS